MQRAVAFVLSFIVWLLLVWNPKQGSMAQDAAVGAGLSILIAAVFGGVYPQHPGRVLDPRRWFWFILYVPYFLYYCVKANLDVAYRVIHPDMPIRPGIVKVSTSLQSDMAKTFLANSITLTPGTLSVDIEGQNLYVHWIYISTDDPQEWTEEIVGRFEPILRRIFD